MKKKKYHINYKKMIRSTTILILLIILIIFLIHSLLKKKTNVESTENISKVEESSVPPKEDISLNFVAIGDIMCHNTNFKTAYDAKTKTYDFSPAFKNVEKYISKADISIGNLETTFAGEEKGYSGYPNFNSPIELGKAIKNIGIDVVSTSNNHTMDKGSNGVISTLDALDEIGISHTGTYRSKEEQNTILVKDVKGLKIAFIAFTYGTNGISIPKDKDYLVNLIDKDLILSQINLAKEQNVDLICASMHWGIEYAQKQNKEQEDLANFLFQNGVDLIIGNHAHVIEPMEKRTITLENGEEKEVFVVYALGNFISGQTQAHTKSTAILDINLTKHGQTDKISIDSVDYIPVYCNDKRTDKNRYELIDVNTAIQEYENGNSTSVNANLYSTLKKELENTKKVLGDPIK